MKIKFIVLLIAILLFSNTGTIAKPVIYYHYDNIIHFLFGKYYSKSQQSIYGYENGNWVCTEIHVTCIGDGTEHCRAVFSAISPNPFSEPETDLMEDMFHYVKEQIFMGNNSGTRTQTIGIQGPDNILKHYKYDMIWNVQSETESSLEIRITEI